MVEERTRKAQEEHNILYDELNKMKSFVENEKKNIQNKTKAQMDIKEGTLAELQKIKSLVGPLETKSFTPS